MRRRCDGLSRRPVTMSLPPGGCPRWRLWDQRLLPAVRARRGHASAVLTRQHRTEQGYDQVKDKLGWAGFRPRPTPQP